MKHLRWIGMIGGVAVLAALLLGALESAPVAWAFWRGPSRAMIGADMMGGGTTSGMMSATTVPTDTMGSGMMNGGMMSGGMMSATTVPTGTMGSSMMSGGMMSGGMMSGGMMSGGMTTDPNAPFDQRFLDQMIMHHQSAILSTQMMVADSARPELRDLAQRITTNQQREVDQMRQWRQDWYGTANNSMPQNMMGGRMMSRDQMRQMMGTTVDFDRMFLQMMIPHHEAALTLAQQALTQAEHPEIKTLAQNIITTQHAEIAEMQGYLTQ